MLAAGIAALEPVTSGAAVPAPATASTCAPHAAEAAARSRLSETVILRVMHVESRGRANAISPKGAIGCMQIMPATWRYLTKRYALGDDPWNARFNMIGGALYLAEMARRFGFPGAFAAYNAGPERYARHVRGGGRLPAETVAYMASLSGGAPVRRPPADDARAGASRWQEAGLFLHTAQKPALPKPAVPESPAPNPAPDTEVPARAEPVGAHRHDLFPLANSAATTPRADIFREE